MVPFTDFDSNRKGRLGLCKGSDESVSLRRRKTDSLSGRIFAMGLRIKEMSIWKDGNIETNRSIEGE